MMMELVEQDFMAALARHKQPSARWLGYRFSAPPPTRIWTARLRCSTLLDASPSTTLHNRQNDQAHKEGRYHRKYVIDNHILDHNVLIQEQSTERDTVHLCASRSRRWRYAHSGTFTSRECVAHNYDRSHNTPATSASSAERTLSSARLSVVSFKPTTFTLLLLTYYKSGTADRAARPQRTFIYTAPNCAYTNKISGGAYTVSTPAAAAVRSTTRRLREIAEV
jgi:hypothetical protein